MPERKLIPVPFGNFEGWAFIVGISQYQDKSLNLQYAHRDADELYKFLISPSGGCFDTKKIIKLTNKEATTGELFTKLRYFLTKPDKEDVVLLYFSCHGAPNPKQPENIYLLSHDTDPYNIAGTAYPMREIYSSVQETLLAEKVIILADTCHSGAIGVSRGIKSSVSESTVMNAYWQKLSQARGGIALFTSAQNREISFEDTKWGGGHGVFTYYLLEGMRGKAANDEGIVTIQNLFEYVRRNVKEATDHQQHPLIGPYGFDSNLPIAIVPNFNPSSQSTETIPPEIPSTFANERESVAQPDLQLPSQISFPHLPINNISRRQLLKGLGWGGAGIGIIAVAKIVQQLLSSAKESYQFQVVTVNSKGEEINRETKEAKYFTDDLGNGVTLDMVSIPAGKFMMGTDDAEIERLVKKFNWDGFRREKPQHEVTLESFFMSKFLITQAQWEVIASRTGLKIKRDLKANPSHFSGDDNLPVESVSWYDAVEFCARLAKLTEKNYRLASEAQWEYACRAVSSDQLSVNSKLTVEEWNNKYHQPFHFGETITSDLANYNGNNTFADEPKGNDRGKTTVVGTFAPNSFGLYDMHGNVLEWCEDDWHENYKNAPDHGRAWTTGESNIAVVRGGSWVNIPTHCRSAIRRNYGRANNDLIIGFRVVCVGGRNS